MQLVVYLLCFLLIVRVDLRRQNESYDLDDNSSDRRKSYSNKEFLNELFGDDDSSSSFTREKKYPSRKKVLEPVESDDEPVERPLEKSRPSHSSKTRNESSSSANYFDEASLCINEFDIKAEQLVKVKDFQNGAHMIKFVMIEEPSSAHGLDIKDICMLNCCVEKACDLAMLSEQPTANGYKCYLFACNGSCTYAPHRDYTSMILKKDLSIDAESSTARMKNKDKASDASSSTLAVTCRSSEFSCRDGTCIPYYDVCNSYEDCPSGIDEAMCSQEFLLHQRTQQENRKKPNADVDNEIDEVLDELLDDDGTGSTTVASSTLPSRQRTKPTTSTPKISSQTKNKGKNREETKNSKNSSFVYNTDLETQERVSKLQKLKEHLEETKGPEAWYHLYQTLLQHQQQDHSNLEPEITGSASSSNDEDSFKDNLIALEQKWIAGRQKTTTTSTTIATTTLSTVVVVNSRPSNRKPIRPTTKPTKITHDEMSPSYQRGNNAVDEELTDDEDEEGTDDGDRYFWQPSYDDRRGNRYNYPRKMKTTTMIANTRRNKMKTRETTVATLLRANTIESDSNPHTRSFLRESSVILVLLVGLSFTVVLLVLVGFYCRDSWKRGRTLKNRSTDADYLINGLYL